MRAFAFTLSLLCALPLHAETKDQLDILRARSNEQERQIRTLENEIESLYGQLALERRRSKVTIPSSSSAVRSGAAKTKSYVVTTGDTLSSIAREHRCSVVSLMRANSIEDPTRLRAGQQISLPSDSITPSSTHFFKKTPPKAVPVAEEETKIPSTVSSDRADPTQHGVKNYKVQRGDTLYGIARRHGLSMDSLRALNPDIEDRILVGQHIALGQRAGRKPQENTPQSTPVTLKKSTSSPKTITYKPVQTNPQTTKKLPAMNKTKIVERAKAPTKPDVSSVDLRSGKTKPMMAPKRISSVFVSEEVTFGDFARRHGTTPEQLNALNGWDFRGSLLLAKGSEIYVPGS